MRTLQHSLLVALLVCAPAATARAAPHFGFTGFPYANNGQALDDVETLIRENADLWAVHLDLDDCIPWREALRGDPFPPWFQGRWDGERVRIPVGHRVSLAATPTTQDRRSLEFPCGASEGAAGTYPSEFDEMGGIDPSSGTAMAHPRVREAYENYVARAVTQFSPDYLSIGIEMTLLATQFPLEWPAFEGLADQTRDRIHSDFPGLPVGVEHVLQSLLTPAVAALVKPQIERNDFLGISFYPFGSEFGVLFGDPPLPAPPAQWRDPLAWLATYTDLPIAIVETGHTSQTVALPLAPGGATLSFPGDETVQDQYLAELVATARADDYLFVVWFVPVDYDPLLVDPGLPPEGQIWTYNGLLDSSLQAKPAWSTWQALVVPEPAAGVAGLAVVGALMAQANRRGGGRRDLRLSAAFFRSKTTRWG